MIIPGVFPPALSTLSTVVCTFCTLFKVYFHSTILQLRATNVGAVLPIILATDNENIQV